MSNLTGRPVTPKGQTRRKKLSEEKKLDKAFLAWLRTQPSAYSGKMPCVAAHYRTAANSGIGIKPIFSALPLTDAEHKLQHQVGTFNFMPREWWEEKVSHYITEWRKHVLSA